MHHVDCSDKSSLIKEIEYYEEYQELDIIFQDKYYIERETYTQIDYDTFLKFTSFYSLGKFYLNIIKPFYNKKQVKYMAQQDAVKKKPKTRNKASDKKRFINISINTDKIKKEWIHVGEKGNYLHVTLSLLPDGTVDAYGNLGMVTQDVPKEIYEAEKNSAIKSQGEILGNGLEWDRGGYEQSEGAPGTSTGKLLGDQSGGIDDLPF